MLFGQTIIALVALALYRLNARFISHSRYGFVKPIFQRPPQNQQLFLQNNGYCFNAKKVDTRFTVDFVEISQVTKQQVWSHRQDGRILNTEFNQCLSIALDGSMSLCGCDDQRANSWEINWERGILRETKWNKVIGFSDRRLILQDFSQNIKDSKFFYTPYAVYENVEQPQQVPLPSLQPRTPFSIQHAANYLAMEKRDNRYTVTTVQHPTIFQQQNWMVLEDGRLKNLIFRECLAPSDQTLTLCGCDDTSRVGYWEYKSEQKVIVEKKLRKAISFEGNRVALKQYVENKVEQSFKWETKHYESTALQPLQPVDNTFDFF
jgi:hypothetical protein